MPACVLHRVGVLEIDEIVRLTQGRGVDVAIEALGTQSTFESCLRVLRPGGTLSSLGVYSSDLTIPLGPFAAGLADTTTVITLCPGGKERMRRLMSAIESGRADLRGLLTQGSKRRGASRQASRRAIARSSETSTASLPNASSSVWTMAGGRHPWLAW
jgi:threonine dehydrogenase-like Zn-dependent dehydrogenase